MLTITDLSVTLPRMVTLLDNLSLTLPTGGLVGLLGPNGAGKSTLMHTIMGLTSPAYTTGSLMLDNQDITQLPPEKRAQRGIVYLTQHSSLFKNLSVSDNLQVVYDYHTYWQNKPLSAFYAEQNALLQTLGIIDLLDRPAGVLSGGQKRKVEAVRALLMQPKLLLCDEPFAGVDPKSINELQELLRNAHIQRNMTLLISDHNVDQLINFADTHYVVLAGRIVVHGSKETVLSNKIAQEQYFGQAFTSR